MGIHRRARLLAVGAMAAATAVAAMPAQAAPAAGASQGAGQAGPGKPGPAVIDGSKAKPSNFADGHYIVVLREAPSTTYDGGTTGFPATKAPKGKHFNARAAQVTAYERHVKGEQSKVARGKGVTPKVQFARALNGFSADLKKDQAQALAADSRVLAVVPDTLLKTTYSSADALGLTGKKGAWATTYGRDAKAGKGVVVGVLDSGVNPTNPFVAGKPLAPLVGAPKVGEPYLMSNGRVGMLKANGETFVGDCTTGPDFPATSCSTKYVTARKYNNSFTQTVPIAKFNPAERDSPLGVFSHGTHVATTAAGNANVEQISDGRSFGKGSGVAPAAVIASYKICWEGATSATTGCSSADAVEAIEQAILDNVDVLNYSISGNNNSVVDPVALAFKGATEAGIFVTAAAGNSGPSSATANHSSPWVTTVAATSFSNELTGTVIFEDGTKYRGASLTEKGVGPAEVVYGADVARDGVSASSVRLCMPNALDPAKATGKIVLCARGTNERTQKSQVVKDAGGVGMILLNGTPNSEDADNHVVPTVHLSDATLREKVLTTDQKVTLVPGDQTGLPPVPQPQVASFSSRGPVSGLGGDVLKPDIAAPGATVLAGVTPLDPTYNGNQFGFMSGTSMASPQVAGMAALLSAKHPDWSPMAMKSAMMTTAADVKKTDGSSDPDNFATGAGMVNAAGMDAPGLVYESDSTQWDKILDGTLAARDLNLPSVALADVLRHPTVTRTVTALENGTWSFAANVPGFDVKASPATLRLKKGQSAAFTLIFTRTDAPVKQWAQGSVTWSKTSGAKVTSPVALFPESLVAPVSVQGAGASGSLDLEVLGGMNATITPKLFGLDSGKTVTFEKTPGLPFDFLQQTDSQHTEFVNLPFSGGPAELVSFTTASTDPKADYDMIALTSAFTLPVSATPGSSAEDMAFVGFPCCSFASTAWLRSNGGGSSPGSMQVIVAKADNHNMKLGSDTVDLVQGERAKVTVNWSGLTPGRWRGVVKWEEGKRTVVDINVE